MSSIPSPNPSPPMFLDVGRLIESSQPRPRQAWGWYALLGFGAVVVAGSYAKSQGAAADQAMSAVLGLLVLGVVVAMSFVAGSAARAQKQEQQRLEAVEELVQLRRWDQAAFTLDTLLSQPTRSEASRLQALIYLASVLARYHRFADAITVQDYLLDHAQFDPATAHGLKLMRAMAMLHEDHLFDADRAIGELRRESTDSAGLALIEMYRDVKTGHPAEAVEIFNARLPEMRNQLGGRVADAYALAAKSYDLMEREAEAASHWEKATLLAPAAELLRRYPELTTVHAKYPAAVRPEQGGAK